MIVAYPAGALCAAVTVQIPPLVVCVGRPLVFTVSHGVGALGSHAGTLAGLVDPTTRAAFTHWRVGFQAVGPGALWLRAMNRARLQRGRERRKKVINRNEVRW